MKSIDVARNKKKLIIIGAGGHGRVVADIALKTNKWEQIAFLDDDETIKVSMGISVIGKLRDVFEYINESDIFVAIGNNKLREEMQNKLKLSGASIPTLIHPNAVI